MPAHDRDDEATRSRIPYPRLGWKLRGEPHQLSRTSVPTRKSRPRGLYRQSVESQGIQRRYRTMIDPDMPNILWKLCEHLR